MGVLEREIPAVHPADLAVGLERAEPRVDEAQPVEDFVDRLVTDVFVANVNDDRHTHHVLDATQSGCRRAAIRSDLVRLDERLLQRLHKRLARVRGARDDVDVCALRLQRRLAELRECLLHDVEGTIGVVA